MNLAEKFNHDFKKGNFKLFDSNGNKIYYENSNEYWFKKEFDSNGKTSYYVDSTGYWVKTEFDSKGNQIFFEDSKGFWSEKEFDSKGNLIYYENSNGEIEDSRPTSSCKDKIVEIDGKKYQLKEI